MGFGGVNIHALSRDDLIQYLQASEKARMLAEVAKQKVEEENKKLKIAKITNLNNGQDLKNISDAALAEIIKKRLPTCTYDSVSVTTLKNFEHLDEIKDVKKIVLKREVTVKLIIDTPAAFFSTLFKSNSLYIKVLNETGIKQFLLDSSELDGQDQLVVNIKKDLQAAYTQYKLITIYLAEDCSNEAQITINSGSKIIQGSISGGKIIKNLISK